MRDDVAGPDGSGLSEGLGEKVEYAIYLTSETGNMGARLPRAE
jgi:hypothetical protein